jgi:RecA-family ATPase
MGLPDDEQLVVYRLPEITEAISLGRRIYICEGEKDVHTAVALGVDATCNQGGCGGGWRAQYNETFRGADVVIVPDNDDAGRRHAENIAASLRGVAATTRILKLWDSWRDCPPKGDLTKWVEAGHTREQFDALVDAAPVPEPKLPFIDMSNWDNEIPPRQEWAVSDRIPSGHVSLFSGEGGAGKSLIMLQWAACHVLGRDWFDAPLKQGPALLIDAEDDEKVIHKRLADIVEYHGVKIADVVQRGLRVASLAGKDAVLATFSHKSGKMEPTPLYDTLLEVAGDIKPVVTGIAASADVFAGDEIDRSQVRQFIAMLTRIAMTAGGAVVLISHPSQSGISSGSGLSGSTAWHNSVRSRFYLKGVKPEKGDDDDDEAPDNDLREIEFRKNNYGPISESITLRYQNGLFLPMTASTADQAVRELEAEQVFLAVLSRFTNQKQYVSANKKAPNYAPAAIARHPDATGFRKTELESAMQRLLDSYSIRIAEEGPAWRKRTYLAAGKKVVL